MEETRKSFKRIKSIFADMEARAEEALKKGFKVQCRKARVRSFDLEKELKFFRKVSTREFPLNGEKKQ